MSVEEISTSKQDSRLTHAYGPKIGFAVSQMVRQSGHSLAELTAGAPDSLPGIANAPFYHMMGNAAFEILNRRGMVVQEAEPIEPSVSPMVLELTHHSKKRPWPFPAVDITAPYSYFYTKYGLPLEGMAKKELFEGNLGELLTDCGAHPLDRHNKEDLSPVTNSIDALNGGRWPAMYAEGYSTPGHVIAKPKLASILIPVIADVRMLPVATITKPVAKGRSFSQLHPETFLNIGAPIEHGWDERRNYSQEELVGMLKKAGYLGMPDSLKRLYRPMVEDLRSNLQSLFDTGLEHFGAK